MGDRLILMCLNKECPVNTDKEKYPDSMYIDLDFDENVPDRTRCPGCGAPVVLPEKCCGVCINSAELKDASLICCRESTRVKLNIMPFNAEASKCPQFGSFDDFASTAEEELNQVLQEVEESIEDLDSDDEVSIFDRAFEDIED